MVPCERQNVDEAECELKEYCDGKLAVRVPHYLTLPAEIQYLRKPVLAIARQDQDLLGWAGPLWFVHGWVLGYSQFQGDDV